MVLPAIVGVLSLLGLGGFIYSVSQLIHPVSVLLAVVLSIATYWYAGRIDILQPFNRGWMNAVVRGVIGIAVGFAVYRALGWAIASVGLLTGLILLGVLFIGGTGLLQVLISRLVLDDG